MLKTISAIYKRGKTRASKLPLVLVLLLIGSGFLAMFFLASHNAELN